MRSSARSWWFASLVAFEALLLFGCGKASPEPSSADDVADPAASDPAPKGEATDEPPTLSAPPPSSPSTARAVDSSDDRELTAVDCRALGQKYGALTRSDEMAKLNPRLTDAQREAARGAFDQAAELLAGRWIDSCVGSLVGKVASEASLKCAMASKTVAAFDVCINGPASPPDKPGR